MQVLNYAHRTRRRGWRIPALLAISVAILSLMVQKRFKAIEAIQMKYDRWRCDTFAVPGGHVALEFDQGLAAGLIASGQDYVASPVPRFKYNPKALFIPSVLQRYSPAAVYPGQATPFMHRRTSAGGTTRLVIILAELHDYFETSRPMVSLDRVVIDSPELVLHDMGEPMWIDPWAGVVRSSLESPLRNRIFSGEPDPSDSSRFTIDYVLWGIPDTIDGRLLDDGTVSLRARRGALIERDLWLPID